ncbi:MAG: (Fe-S)-binding protein, partial [Nitrospira sp.]
LARRHLRERYAHVATREIEESPTRTVAYFHGCAANYFDDGVGDAVIEVLKKHGVEPALPPQRCSGTPIQTYGHVDLVRDGARFNLRSFAPYETIVTGCASCTLMLKDYPTLFPEGAERQQAESLAKKVVHISEFVARSSEHPPMATTGGTTKRVTYHSSCHLRAAGVTKEPRQILSSLPGVNFVEMQDADRCAGGAGTYVVKDYDTSKKIFDRKAHAINQSGAHVVATSCPACMIQLKNGLDHTVEVKHVAQLLQEAYRAAEDGKS